MLEGIIRQIQDLCYRLETDQFMNQATRQELIAQVKALSAQRDQLRGFAGLSVVTYVQAVKEREILPDPIPGNSWTTKSDG